jgi:hypothetical protein
MNSNDCILKAQFIRENKKILGKKYIKWLESKLTQSQKDLETGIKIVNRQISEISKLKGVKTKRPFIDELMELCERRGYTVQAVGVEGNIVEVTLSNERGSRAKESTIAKDFRIKEEPAV